MPLNLTDRDRAMLDGRHGPAVQMAMTILVRMAQVYGAAELMDIRAAHIEVTPPAGRARIHAARPHQRS